jgi:putative FmdB family regulatory protein
MPLYDYHCSACGGFEMSAGRDERWVKCACGLDAERRPFSGVPYLKGETMPKQIPDEAYRFDAQKREFERSWGPEERAVEMMRANLVEDNQGRKSVNTKAMSAT